MKRLPTQICLALHVFSLKFCGLGLILCKLEETYFQLVVSTPLKNISQIGNLPQIGMKMKNIWNHHLDFVAGQQQNLRGPKNLKNELRAQKKRWKNQHWSRKGDRC